MNPQIGSRGVSERPGPEVHCQGGQVDALGGPGRRGGGPKGAQMSVGQGCFAQNMLAVRAVYQGDAAPCEITSPGMWVSKSCWRVVPAAGLLGRCRYRMQPAGSPTGWRPNAASRSWPSDRRRQGSHRKKHVLERDLFSTEEPKKFHASVSSFRASHLAPKRPP